MHLDGIDAEYEKLRQWYHKELKKVADRESLIRSLYKKRLAELDGKARPVPQRKKSVVKKGVFDGPGAGRKQCAKCFKFVYASLLQCSNCGYQFRISYLCDGAKCYDVLSVLIKDIRQGVEFKEFVKLVLKKSRCHYKRRCRKEHRHSDFLRELHDLACKFVEDGIWVRRNGRYHYRS